MTRAISMLNNIFPLHINHLKYPMCYTKCHKVYNFTLQKLLILSDSIMLIISGHDNLRPVGI